MLITKMLKQVNQEHISSFFLFFPSRKGSAQAQRLHGTTGLPLPIVSYTEKTAFWGKYCSRMCSHATWIRATWATELGDSSPNEEGKYKVP